MARSQALHLAADERGSDRIDALSHTVFNSADIADGCSTPIPPLTPPLARAAATVALGLGLEAVVLGLPAPSQRTTARPAAAALRARRSSVAS
jgi:hypothetical protein